MLLQFDLLYPDPATRARERERVHISPNLLHDMRLDELVENQVLNEAEYGQFAAQAQYLPTSGAVASYRQQILTDFLRYPYFLKQCMDFCGSLKDDLPRKGFNKGYNVWEKAQTPIHQHLWNYIGLLEENYRALCDMDVQMDFPFTSQALKGLVHFLKDDAYKTRLREIIDLLSALLNADAVGYRTEYTYAQALKTVSVQAIYGEPYYVTKERGIFKKKIIDEEHLLTPGENYILKNNINEVYLKTLVRLCDFAARLNSALVKPFKEIQDQLLFYQAGLKLQQAYKELRVPWCLPQVLADADGRMRFQGLYPLHLLTRCVKESSWDGPTLLTTNDYSNEEGRIAIITGFNSGGKTTFLQSVGAAQVLAQSGFHVPAKSFCFSPAPYVGSLFSNIEDIHTIHGKLEQELVDIHDLTKQLAPGSLVLMNEILATTSEKEASEILAEVLHAFSGTGSHIMVVTHLGALADWVEEKSLPLANGEAALNYVAERIPDKDGEPHKTHRILRGVPQKDILEQELLEAYTGKR